MKSVVADPPFLYEVVDLNAGAKKQPLDAADKRPMTKQGRHRAPRKWTHGRSVVTGGEVFVMGLDTRNAWVRRCSELIRAHLSDLGGVENASVAQQSLVRRVSALTVELEFLEGTFARAGNAQPCDLALYAVVAAKLHRMLETLGTKRVPKDVTGAPRLSDLLSKEIEIAVARENDADDEEEDTL